jgi:zinc-binding alcohol dehydrogenase/oxidoreductase
MKAIILKEKHQAPSFEERETPVPTHDQELVALRAAALNHRDVWIRKGLYAGIRFPFVPGSDGAGFVGDRPVIINPGISWGSDERYQSDDFHILGMPTDGTFAEYVVVPKAQVYDMPQHLSFEEAAALPLAGLSAFRAVFGQGRLQVGQRVLITGIGGGVALCALQFAHAAGAEVWVSSSSEDKLDRAIRLGAAGGYNYRDPEWTDKVKQCGGFDLIVDGAGGAAIGELLKYCNKGARIVLYGGTAGAMERLLPQIIFWKQLHLIGTSMGSALDFERMLAFVNEHKLVPVVDRIFRLQEASEAFERMEKASQFGKLVLQIT